VEVHHAYRRLVVRVHPDRAPAGKAALHAAMFDVVRKAHEVLSSSVARNAYDQKVE